MDNEVKQTLASLTEQLIKATEAAYRAEVRANSACAFIAGRHPQAAAEFEEYARRDQSSAQQREAEIQKLNSLLKSLK